jgi:chorismate dehydratase
MLHCALTQVLPPSRPRLCAVSFLNTVPLVWGMLHGSQSAVFDLSFAVPSECADRVARGEADLGILPVAEIQRLDLPYLPDVGIACTGAVRSILLVTKVPPAEIRTLAGDSSSRTSVMLARVVLARRYGIYPGLRTIAPDLETMLADCDAALIIGDPALRTEPNLLPYEVLDLGSVWMEMTGLPFVFALWSGAGKFMGDGFRRAFADSCRFGLDRIDDIVRLEAPERGFSEDVVRTYLTKHVEFLLTPDHLRGLELFWRYTRELRD